MDISYYRLSNRIPVLRAEHDFTQKELAQKAHVSRQTIISIEKNRYAPSLILAFTIAHALEAKIEDVFQFEVNKE